MARRKERVSWPRRISRVLDGMRGRSVEWNPSRFEGEAAQIDIVSSQLKLPRIGDDELKQHASRLGKRAKKEPLEHLRAEAFALVSEAATRALGLRYFDVQITAGLALEEGNIVEMQTGEGKTLVAVLPAFLNALTGRGVHVLTFNDYLAKRDAAWMGPIYELLGMTASFIEQGMTAQQRIDAYECQVTYLTAKEVGYDLLRDNLARDPGARVLRPFNFAVVDEADSLLIDEARVPLVIAGSDETHGDLDRLEIAKVVSGLDVDLHIQTDRNGRTVCLTEEGEIRMLEMLGCESLTDPTNRVLATKLHQALHASELLSRDVDYIVRDGSVKIVDEFTGRVVEDRHWPDGLHRAVEAKEGLRLEDQGCILGSITLQHLINLYPSICGMTGTVIPSEEEFETFYGLKTVIIPSNKPCIRTDHPDLLFIRKEDKCRAIIEEVVRVNDAGRPILIGTASVEESQSLASLIRAKGIACSVLNAANDEEEAAVIAQAGAPGAVTVSTNMAGRGTDIRLGGADERDSKQVSAAGGLCVIGTVRFESRRIDDQLRGRAGRQGDPGSSRFFVSIEDDIIKKFGLSEYFPGSLQSTSSSGPIADNRAHKKIARTQRIIEGQNLEIRRTLWNYTSIVEKQRLKMHEMREAALLKKSTGRFEKLCPEKYFDLAKKVPQSVLEEAESQITLFHLDNAWANHLAVIADIREGVHLIGLGGRNPLHEYHKSLSSEFDGMLERLDDNIRASLKKATIDAVGIDLDKEGLRGPTSTWTYLINDNPFDGLSGISSPGNIGLGVAAGLLGGLFVFKAIWDKFRSGKGDGF